MKKKTVVIVVQGGIVIDIYSTIPGLQTFVLDHDNAEDLDFDPEEIDSGQAVHDPKLLSFENFKRRYAKVICSACQQNCLARTAHHHQRQWIGDGCCWNEQLRSSE